MDVLMFGRQFLDDGVEFLDTGLDGGNLANQCVNEFGMGHKDAFLSAEGNAVLDDFDAILNDFGAATAMGEVELGDGGWFCFLDGLKGRPFGEKGTSERGVDVAPDELEGLWEAVFEGLGEFVGQAGTDANELASLLGEQGDLVSQRIGGAPWLEFDVAFKHEERERFGIASVVFGAGWAEAFAVFFDDGRIGQVEAQECELAEEVNQVLARLLDAKRNGLAFRQGFFEFPDPGQQGLGGAADLGLRGDFSGSIQRAGVDGSV